VETSGVAGTHPALTEAMAFGNCVVVHNTPENLETIGNAGFAYDGRIGVESLRRVLQHPLSQPRLVDEYRERACQRAQTHYMWEAVTDAYERWFANSVEGPFPNDCSRAQSWRIGPACMHSLVNGVVLSTG